MVLRLRLKLDLSSLVPIATLLLFKLSLHGERVRDRLEGNLSWTVNFDAKQ